MPNALRPAMFFQCSYRGMTITVREHVRAKKPYEVTIPHKLKPLPCNCWKNGLQTAFEAIDDMLEGKKPTWISD